ncbi:MAG: DUF5686 and carboxypeptidase regulatory-like domain-containing protein [Prevotella sp.]|nr:DUF5686 and carboxypeptidase regulatory-like domain-containing protein [Prevotella sp.]
MKKTIVSLLMALMAIPAIAQKITGVVVDDNTGDSIALASAIYRGHHVMVAADEKGQFSIDRHDGWYLTFSALGYKPQRILIGKNSPSKMRISLKPEANQLEGVVVKQKRQRYSRKNNPAVELMRRVIEAKKKTNLANHDYYQFNKYQKMTLGLNDLTPTDLEGPLFKKRQWLLNQVEVCPLNSKLILPISVSETVTKKMYRKDPKTERDIIMGESSTGINDLFETGDIMTTMVKDVFTDVDIYDDEIRLLQYPFTSPIGKGAISFYRFYIADTLMVGRDSCFHVQFMPNNQQDFGFRGDLYILKDSTLHVKTCNLTIPKKSDVNFVDNLQIRQSYEQVSSGEWVLTEDDMFVELSLAKFLTKAIVIRTTRMQDYDFEEINNKLLKGKAKVRHEANSKMRDDDFWNQYRSVQLTDSEKGMDDFLANLEKIKGFKYGIFALRALVENFIDTGSKEHPSKVDIGPINTMLTKNFVDGTRTRLSAQTTANLNPHWFFNGYYARGWDSKKNYYKGEVTYSFNKKDYLPREFPKRTLTFTSTYDVCSPSDKFVHTDKDNVFTSFKWSTVDKMMFYNRQQLTFEREEEFGFKTTVSFKAEENEACGNLFFRGMDVPVETYDGNGPLPLHNGKIRTTELSAQLRFAPGETFVNTKQRRLPINLDAPVFTVSHTMGFNKVLGGQYDYQFTEASIYKRFWLPMNFGKIDFYAKGGIQWSKVPFPLLIMPAANLSYIIEDETFNLVNNMEFLNDRYVSVDFSWDMNGKILNRIPLLKKLKWREFFGVKMLWGTLTDKNNPLLIENADDPTLMPFPQGSFTMDKKQPYFEIAAGIHNIFKILHVEYVRRLSYLNLPTANKEGVRFMLRMTF